MEETAKPQLYDLGYLDLSGKLDDLVDAAKNMNALVVDCRFSPRSRNPTWNRGNMEKRLGRHYVSMREFGNENYKGGEVKLHDPDKGAEILHTHLDAGEYSAVVLMCACWNREKCHRLDVARFLEPDFGPTTPLTAKMVQEFAALHKPKQLNLFGE